MPRLLDVDMEAPRAEVVSVAAHRDSTVIGLILSADAHPPLAPASLVEGDDTVVELEAVIGTEGPVTLFRTHDAPPDLVGKTLGLQSWWIPEAFDAVTDTARRWSREDAPSPEGHHHCLLDWQTIEQGVGESTGWRSGADWVCTACFQRYFVEDRLGIRGRGASGHPAGSDDP